MRQAYVQGGNLVPGDEGVASTGLPYHYPAAREGGPRNGVLTAVEDFVAARDDIGLAVIPAFFGLGVVWDRRAPWAQALAEVVEQWDGNPLLERLEANRVFHLARSAQMMGRAGRQEAVLRRLLESKAFTVAEWLSRLRYRAGIATEASVISKEEIRRAVEP